MQKLARKQLIGLVIFSAALSMIFAVQIWSGDIWWHLATARWIVENGSIPTVDPFSFTIPGEKWVNVNWLGALFYYAAYSIGGISGLVVSKILIGFILIIFLGLALKELDISFPLIVASLICFAVLVQPRFSLARPASIGALLCSISIYLSIRTGKRRDLWVYALIPLCAIWMFIHSSVLVCVFMSILLSVAAFMFKTPRGHRIATSIVSCANVGLLVVTEKGRQVLTQIISYDPESLVVKYTTEWQSLQIEDSRVWVPWTLFAISLIYGLARYRKHPVPLGLAILGVYLGTRFNRHLYIGVLMIAPVFTLAVMELSQFIAKRGWNFGQKAMPFVLCLSVLGFHMTAEPRRALNTDFGFGIMTHRYAHDTLGHLRTLPFGRVINDYHIGGYLIWHEIPGGVYIDARTVQVFKEHHLRSLYVPILEGGDGLEKLADSYQVKYGLGQIDYPVFETMMASPKWTPVHIGDTTVLFARTVVAKSLKATHTPVFSLLRFTIFKEKMREIYGTMLSTSNDEREFVDQFVEAAEMNPDSRVLAGIQQFLKDWRPALAETVATRLEENI